MEKIKWIYHKHGDWIADNTVDNPNDGFIIFKTWGNKYKLQPDKNNPFGIREGLYFRKLSSAKKVANLLRNG